MIGSKSRKTAAAVALVMAGVMAVPAAASAQSYGSYPYSSHGYGSYGYSQAQYDPCVREQTQRGTTGGLLGAAIGAVAGSQIAARGRRTEGSVLGGVLGAAIGAGVGNSSAACRPGQYTGGGYDRYATAYAPPPPPAYEEPRYDDRYDRYPERDYGYRAETPYQNTDGCRLAESTIRLPDGRTESRYVRTCPDEYGRYRVVD